MKIRRTSVSTILLLPDLLFIVFCIAAVDHLLEKPILPKDILDSSQFYIGSDMLRGENEVEFFISHYRVGDTVETRQLHDYRMKSTPVINYYKIPIVLFNLFIVLSLFVLGLFVYLRRPDNPPSKIFHLASVTAAFAAIGTKTLYSVSPPLLGSFLCTIFFTAYTLIPVLLLHFTFLFPSVRKYTYRNILFLLYPVGLIISFWYAYMYLDAASENSITLFRRTDTISMFQNGFVFITLCGAVWNFIISYRSAKSTSEKRKIRWILYSLCVGPAPFVFLWVLPTALGLSPWVPEFLFKSFLLIIPVTFALSILKYRAMDIELFISRGTVYAIVIGIGLVIYLVVIVIASKLISHFTTETSIIVSTVTAVFIALTFEPARRRVQKIVDHLFFRVQYDYRRTQQNLIGEIKGCIDVSSLGKLIVRRIDEILKIEKIGFFKSRDPDYRMMMIAHKNFDILDRHNVSLSIDKLKSDLRLPLALADRIEPGVNYEQGDPEVFQRWGASLVFPILTERAAILGFIVLGEKKSGLRFTSEDVDLLGTIAVQTGLTIERIELQHKLLLEQAETLRLEELNKLKSYFVSSVSHDLKTPLTSIKMFAELLRTKKRISKSETEEYLEIIEGESERLTRLINNVLDFSKIERGVKEYHFSEIELNSLVKKVLKSLYYQFKIEKCVVHEHLCDGACILNADKDAVTEALINLISNAIKYSHDEKIISVSIERQDGYIGVRVSDKGVGISSEELPYISQPYYRAKGGKRGGTGGTGLGLAIVNHIMDAHGGKIEVKSAPGEGSTFTLLFPYAPEVSK